MADPSKTEKPTSRRLSEARKKGQVPKSIEVTTAVTFLTAILMLRFYGKYVLNTLKDYVAFSMQHLHQAQINDQNILALELDVFIKIAIILLPFILVIMVAAYAINYAQVGFLFTFEPLKPSFGKINPLRGVSNLFSKRGLEMLLKSLVKLSIISWMVYGVLKNELPGMFPLIDADLLSSIYIISDICYKIAIRVAIFFAVIAVFDYAWQRYQYMENLKMTKQEVKDESKRTEGNPQIKGEIRRRMRQMMRSRMIAQVPKADVVVTNPTHIAVALQYDSSTMGAPALLAKGADLIAQTIKDVAKDHHIPIVENKSLARAIYQQVEIGDEVPEDLFNAVAEVLTYVHNLTGKSFGL